MSTLNILIACGGTGGHLFPGIAVAQELRRRGHHPILLISQKKVDREAIAKYTDMEYITTPAIAKPPMLSLRMPSFLLQLAKSCWQSKKLIKEKKIDIILGMGGFTSLPPIYAGNKEGKACYVHDSNALPGKANKLTARWCRKVLIGLSDAAKYFPKSECILTGTPCREELQTQQLPSKEDARRQLGVPMDKALILVLGGSQGARRLNEIILEAAAQDSKSHYLIIAGQENEERVRAAATPNVSVMGFCAQMAEAYAACDGIISRSGASTLTEISLIGRAALLIPFPAAADDHQTHNARAFSSQGAAVLCAESELSSEKVHHFVEQYVLTEAKRQGMEEAMRQLARLDAASCIADSITQ